MLINKKNPHGGDVYKNAVELDFSANVNPYGTPEIVKQAIRKAAESCDIYPDAYCTELRSAISKYEGVPADHILCANGAAELIYQFAYVISDIKKDKPVLIIAPTFVEYFTALCAAGLRAEYYYLDSNEDFRLNSKLLTLDFSQYSAVFVCSPNNPTGITISSELLTKIAENVQNAKIHLFCDISFLDLSDRPYLYDIPSLTASYPSLIFLRAFTKSYAMAGVRLGYVISSDVDFLELMSEKVQCWNVSALAQAAGVAALKCSDWLENIRCLLHSERDRVRAELETIGIKVYPSEANFLLFRAAEELGVRLRENGIMIRDCSNYVGLSRGYYRIGIRTPSENNCLLQAIRNLYQ